MLVSSSFRRGCIPVPRSEASCFSTMFESVVTPFCIVSSNSCGDLNGVLALSSMTCSCISLPKMKWGSSMKLSVFPQ